MINRIKGVFSSTVPRREVLEKEISKLGAKKLFKKTQAAFLKAHVTETSSYNKAMKELALLDLRLQDAVDEYNRFVAKEDACQKAFERLNGLDKQT